MKLVLLQTGKTTEKYVTEGAVDFSARISRFTAFEIITIPDLKNTKNMPPEEQRRREGGKLMQYVGNNDYVVLLDEKGKELRTTEFAAMLQKMLMLPKKRLVFVIGGPWGFPGTVYDRADVMLSLSRMTYSHQLARLLFLEQLYRAFTILKGEPYHHE
jgi:23S rRNA (pseudouridine1915-N3)-methyltransferase